MKNKMKRRKKPKKKVRVLGESDVEDADNLIPSEKSSIEEVSKEESSSSMSFSSDGFSSIDSQASRVNFWMDINTNDNEYTNAVIARFDSAGPTPRLSR